MIRNDPTRSFGLSDIPLVINLVYSFWLLMLLRFDHMGPAHIADENANPKQVVFVSIIFIATVMLARFTFETDWYLTYAWTVSASVFAKEMALYLFPIRRKRTG